MVVGMYGKSVLEGTPNWKYICPSLLNYDGFTMATSAYGTMWYAAGYIN